MGRTELKVDLNALTTLTNRFKDPNLEAELRRVPAMKEIAALVAQAIADNFAQQGPGWLPLKAATIRQSVSKKIRKKISGMSDTELLIYEKQAKLSAENLPNRQILRRTSLLYQTVTTPGYSGSAQAGARAQDDRRKGGKSKLGGPRPVSGQNIYRVEGSNLIWGTNLVYAGIHNEGGKAGRGRKVTIPKREFLVIHDEWQARLVRFVFKLMNDIVKKHVEGK